MQICGLWSEASRAVSEAVEQKLTHVTGKGKATKYNITPQTMY